jgi:methionyl-tRNA synthetase
LEKLELDEMKYYLTTPIYYTNAAPHLGHAYTTIAADTIKRLKRMQGFDVILTSGTDEHGVNVERAALAQGKQPKEYTDLYAEEFRRQFEILGLQIDRFQRTTSPLHAAVVKDLFLRCQRNGYVYKGGYTGQYCVFDNLYVNDAKPGDPCPECGRPTETVTEENYFFKLSAFQQRLLDHYARNPDFIQPETRRNEMIAFVKQGLQDLSITRTNIKWGIPVPGEEKHVFYVWFDALTAYMSAVAGENRWPADLHLIGKDILRFHAVYWPAFLMAAEVALPKKIFAQGWLMFENEKMSKSRGNVVRPTPIHNVMGTDALRYFLLREVVFGQDGSFSYDALVSRYNADLANGLGNLASRTLTMVQQYRDGRIPKSDGDPGIGSLAHALAESALQAYERFEFSKAIEFVFALIGRVDKYIVEWAPWKLAKEADEQSQRKLDEILYTAAEAVRLAAVLLYPVIPESAAKIWTQLGFSRSIHKATTADMHWGHLPAGQKLGEVSAVFPRADPKVVIPRMMEQEAIEYERQQALLGQMLGKPASGAAAVTVEAAAPAAPPSVEPVSPQITIEDFAKVDLRVGLVKEAAPVKGADKLLHLKVDIGEAQPRSIVAGIALAYAPEKLVGRKVVIVANLAPRKLRGLESQGMIVAASLPDTPPVLAGFLEDVPIGARLK